MISRIEATNYRCYENLGVDLGAFRVFAGPNGSGKTTLLDIPVLLGDLLRSRNVAAAFFERMLERGARATSPVELTFRGSSESFVLAVEAELTASLKSRLIESSTSAVQKDPSRHPTHVRYEVRLGLTEGHDIEVRNEYLFFFPMSESYEAARIPMQGENAKQTHWRFVIQRVHQIPMASREQSASVTFIPEIAGARKRDAEIDHTVLALARIPFESESEFGVARWLFDTLTEGIVFFSPEWSDLRQASPPGLPRSLMPSGQNVPWLAMRLKSDASTQFNAWVDHVRTALPQVVAIDVREREEDHHAYFRIAYEGGFEVTSSGLSEGTLRILALTLVAYLSEPPRILIVEEPENSIHPQAIETVMQSLASMYDSRVWVSTHSPIVLAARSLSELVTTRLDRSGCARVVSGPSHPRLAEWKGTIDLGTLFATGVLE